MTNLKKNNYKNQYLINKNFKLYLTLNMWLEPQINANKNQLLNLKSNLNWVEISK